MKHIKSLILLSFFTFFAGRTFSQHFSPALQSLINAEKAFAYRSKETNTRRAFLDFLAPDAILLDGGKEVNGIQLWTTRPESSSLLFWEPVYADIASSNDFGWTTGPYWLYKTRSDTVAAFKGYYSTVWGKQPDGTWKVLFDLGGGIPDGKKLTLSTSAIKAKSSRLIDTESELKNLLKFDGEYSGKLSSSGTSFEINYFSAEGRVHRAGRVPAVGLTDIKQIDERDRKYEFIPIHGRIASSGDMAYTYGRGKVAIGGSNPRVVEFASFRIWKKEDGQQWKIVLDVLGQ